VSGVQAAASYKELAVHIDQSRYKAFWQNPERYRLIYECNLHCSAMPYGLARGTAFHRIAELQHEGKALDPDIDAILESEDIEKEARDNAWRMYYAYRGYINNPHPPKVLAMEKEWYLNLRHAQDPVGLEHAMCGRVDQITESNAGLFVVDTKTAHSRTQLARVKKNWLTDKQADFLLIGAKALGYDVKCLLIHVILETTPPRIWELAVTRTPAQLEQTKRSALLTCSIIEHLRFTHGVDEPWPHLDNEWPCSTPDKCDYRSICGRRTRHPSAPTFAEHPDAIPDGFKLRKEHLALLRPSEEMK